MMDKMKFTKRGFLQSIASVLVAGSVADRAQAQGSVDFGPPMELNAPWEWGGGGIVRAMPDCQPSLPVEWSWPSWKAKEEVERKRRFLRDVDPAMGRSGQFTLHEQKKQRWIMRQQYRRFMPGPWEQCRVETIHQWKETRTTWNRLEDLKKSITE